MVLYFITGNENKFIEVSKILEGINDNLERIDLDLFEIQEIDGCRVIEEKLKEAFRLEGGKGKRFFCEDVSFSLECLGGLPGVFIKWFLKTIGDKGIYELVKKYGNDKVVASAIVGYTDGNDVRFFEGVLKGRVVSPRGDSGFGFDRIFQPDGFDKTLAEMSLEEKNKISMRRVALEGLRDYLDSRKF